MKRKELTKIFMVISNWKKHVWSLWFIYKYFSVVRVDLTDAVAQPGEGVLWVIQHPPPSIYKFYRQERQYQHEKWNESGFMPPLCTYRLNWARRTSWGWWDDTVLQTQDSKIEPWRSETKHATSRSRRLPAILSFTRGWGRNILVFFKLRSPGTEPRTLAWKAAVLTTTLGPPPINMKHPLRSLPSERKTFV